MISSRVLPPDGPIHASSFAEVTGQVVNVRRASKRLVFADLHVDGPRDDGATVVELVVKVGAAGFAHESAVAAAHRDVLKPGNVVAARGQWCDAAHGPGSRCLDRLTSLVVLSPWAAANPGVPFVRPALATTGGVAPAAPGSCSAEVARARDDPSATAAPEVDPCKFWVAQGRCLRGDGCGFAHGTARAARLSEWIASRKQRRRAAAARDAGDPHGEGVAHKGARGAVFVRWLEATFGVAVLAAGDGVVDVAGGRGDVAFELHTKRGLRCTLVDPRPRKLSKPQHQWLRQEAAWRQLTAERSSTTQGGGDGGDRGEPRSSCGTVVRLGPSAGPAAAEEDAAAKGSGFTPRKRATKDDAAGGPGLCRHVQAEFGPGSWEAFAGCSVVVGMHPDEATDAIVDFAMAHRKPFAVVPCCVFPGMFPARRTLEGTRVATRAELVAHLAAKAGAQVAFLDVQGANQVVWRRDWGDVDGGQNKPRGAGFGDIAAPIYSPDETAIHTR